MAERIEIASAVLAAGIDPLGAELQSLTIDGVELMWGGDPTFWTGRAPILFPIVGRLRDDRYRVDGVEYSMPKHGFARSSAFEVVETSRHAATFRLTDTAVTRAAYPFAFALEMRFAVEDAALAMTATIANTGDRPPPASFGYHPAFRWPLPFGGARGDHAIVFEHDEPAPLRAITPEGLIGGERASPVEGRTLRLDDALFADDALVWDRIESRRLRYGAPGDRQLDIAFPDTPWLGVWTKPGAGYLCIEPWAGMADPEDFTGDLRDKPGISTIAPGEMRNFRMSVSVTV